MKPKRLFIALAAFLFAAMGYGQVVINEEGNLCVGNGGCFAGFGDTRFDGFQPFQRWTNVNSTTLNVGGGLSVAAMDDGWAFTVSKPFMTTYGMSLSPFFYINGDGTVYSMHGIVQSSDSTLKTNISVLSSALPKIKRLKGVSYNYKEKEETIKQTSSLNAPKQANNKASHKRIGLLAQDVEKVYPEVVYNLNDSTKGIAYADLVAVLVEGIKELDDSLTIVSNKYVLLQEQIKDLQMQMENMLAVYSLEKGKSEKNNSGNASKMMEAALYQNVPNPFSGKTEISYRITPDAQNAYIGIYDLTGKQQKQYALNATSLTGKVEIAASDFEAGMYIYSLVIDGKVIDSKRMLIEK